MSTRRYRGAGPIANMAIRAAASRPGRQFLAFETMGDRAGKALTKPMEIGVLCETVTTDIRQVSGMRIGSCSSFENRLRAILPQKNATPWLTRLGEGRYRLGYLG